MAFPYFIAHNAFIDETSAKIRTKPVPWEGYQRAELITSEELSLIKKVDRQPRAKFESILLSDGPTYALLFLRLLSKLQRIDTMQSILVLIADVITEKTSLFLGTSDIDPNLPFSPLLRSLESQDEFINLGGAQIVTILLSATNNNAPLPSRCLKLLLDSLASLIRDSSQNKRDVSVQCLESLLSRRDCRHVIWAMPVIITGLMEILKQNSGSQISYQVAFCFWLLSFEQNVADELNKSYDAITILIDVARNAVKEKVIRVILATLRNLLLKSPAVNLPAMLISKVLPFVKNLSTRKWQDDDVIEDVQFLKDELSFISRRLSTYDVYVSELLSGHLSWTPVHESDEFWKENAIRLNERDCEHLKGLIRLLENSTDPLVLAVASHDIRQYVKHYRRGKNLVTDLGGKQRIMELMTHADLNVRYHALLSVQLLVSQPWI